MTHCLKLPPCAYTPNWYRTTHMKVLLVTTSYPDFSGSQRGIFIRQLCLELIKNELEVVVLTPKILKDSAYFEEDGGIKVYRFWFPSSNKQLNQMDSIP